MACSLSAALLGARCTCSLKPAHDDAGAAAIADDMARVPAGWFSSGCYRLLASGDARERAGELANSDVQRMDACVEADPPRRLWISSFEVDRFEVTVGEYQRCLHAHACDRPVSRELLPVGTTEALDPRLPAIVTYDDAAALCRWRGKRLPTDAEWQKAARGTDDRIYPWGDARPTCQRASSITAIHDGFDLSCDGFALRPVGVLPAGASAYGVQDLEDNAAEWVSDWSFPYGPARNAVGPGQLLLRPHAFSLDTAGPDPVIQYNWNAIELRWHDPMVIDPVGPPEYRSAQRGASSQHVTKGGSRAPGISGSALAEPGDATHRPYAGFRCVRAVPGSPSPAVRSPAAGQFTVPFREPGYAPPGTPTASRGRQAGASYDRRARPLATGDA